MLSLTPRFRSSFRLALLSGATLVAAQPIAAQVQAQPGAPVQTTEQTFPSVDGGEVHCYPNFTDSERGIESRERLLTKGPRVDFAALLAGARNEPPSVEREAFMKQMADMRANDWAYRCRYRQDNARVVASGVRPDVIFVGDSLTENWPAAHPGFFASGNLGRGVSGQTSSQMLLRFYRDVVELHPRAVHIMAGTNDINGATGPSTLDDVMANIAAMVDLARAHDIEVILAEIPPIDPSSRKPGFVPDPNVLALNSRFRELAQSRDLVTVDYYDVLTDGEGKLDETLSNDGLHPNRAGYEVMEPLTQEAIAQALARAEAHNSAN